MARVGVRGAAPGAAAWTSAGVSVDLRGPPPRHPYGPASSVFLVPGIPGQHPFTIIALPTWGLEPETSSPDWGRPSSTSERNCRPASSPPFPEPLSNSRAGWASPGWDFTVAIPSLWIHSSWKYPLWPLCPGPGNDSDHTLPWVLAQLKIPSVLVLVPRGCWTPPGLALTSLQGLPPGFRSWPLSRMAIRAPVHPTSPAWPRRPSNELLVLFAP